MTASSANRLSRKDGVLLLFFSFFAIPLVDHQLPAFLNNHCEYELWKASLRHTAGRFILPLSLLIPDFSFLINCQSSIHFLYKGNPFHFICMNTCTCDILLLQWVLGRYEFDFIFHVKRLNHMKVAHATLTHRSLSFCRWNYVFFINERV